MIPTLCLLPGLLLLQSKGSQVRSTREHAEELASRGFTVLPPPERITADMLASARQACSEELDDLHSATRDLGIDPF